MASLNQITIIGNLTRDPELKFTQSGQPLVNFTLAANHRYNKGEEKVEEVCFVDVVCFGRMAENVGTYCQKGKSVLVTGRLTQDKWEDRDTGAKRSKHKIMAGNIQFLDGGKKESSSSGDDEDY